MDPYVHPYLRCNSKELVHSFRMHREIESWEALTSRFFHTFSAYEGDLMMDTVLQLARENIFEGIEESKGSLPDWTQFAEKPMECYKLEESKS